MFLRTLTVIMTLNCCIFTTHGIWRGKWTVHIKKFGTDVCVGTIVSRRYVLTHGNCINEKNAGKYRLVFGGGIRRRITAVHQSPIGELLVLLKLNKKISLKSSSSDVRQFATPKLAIQAMLDARENIIYSWDKKDGMEKISIDVVGDGRCNKIYPGGSYGTTRKMCYVAHAKRKTKCYVMGGQPILTKTKSNGWVLLGISAAEDNICNGNYQQGVDILPHVDWINTVLNMIESDCYDLHKYKFIASGIHKVVLWKSSKVIDVVCDSDTDGGGWTVIQSRYNGNVHFYRNFSQYEDGFGSFDSEFWLGLKYIQEIAGQDETELRIDLEAADNTKAYETLGQFRLGQGSNYTLYTGDTVASMNILLDGGFRFGLYHNGLPFSTYDRDMDATRGNCALHSSGGWWYVHCYTANLNGIYHTPGTAYIGNENGMIYSSFKFESLKRSKMMIRRVSRF